MFELTEISGSFVIHDENNSPYSTDKAEAFIAGTHHVFEKNDDGWERRREVPIADARELAERILLALNGVES